MKVKTFGKVDVPPTIPANHPPRSPELQAELPVLQGIFLFALCLIHLAVYTLSVHPTFTTPPCPHVPSLLPPCKNIHLYHFFRFHIYALICNICLSISDLFHFVWQTLGRPISLWMTQFCSFLWLSNILLYICTTSFLSIHLPMDI